MTLDQVAQMVIDDDGTPETAIIICDMLEDDYGLDYDWEVVMEIVMQLEQEGEL